MIYNQLKFNLVILNHVKSKFGLQEFILIMQRMTKYQKVMQGVASHLPEKIRPIFLHPAGPTTIFFWAPTFKWGLVFANIGDLNRPADQISVNQTSVLAGTAAIWCRYSMVIIPKNLNLFLVNFFIVLTSAYNVGRALNHTREKGEK